MKLNHPTERGVGAFTLIELILAVGIMAIVLVAINAVFFSAIRLREATTAVVEESLPVQQAIAVLRRDLQCAVPPLTNGILSGDFKVGDVTSSGTSETVDMELYTTTGALSSRDDEPWGDVQRVTYELRIPAVHTTPTGKDLIRSVTRAPIALTATPPLPEDQLLLPNVESMKYSCYDGTQWLDTWDTTLFNTNLPVAVRVRIQLAGNNAADSQNRQPFEIIVPLESQTRTNSTGG